MNVVRVLVIAAALFVAFVAGIKSSISFIRREYPETFKTLANEMKQREADEKANTEGKENRA